MILQNISLSIQGGEFIALVGGSGAGKSTLLKAMNGYNPATHGRMLINGQPLYPNLDAYRTLMGYVPQDDIIHEELPVRLALWYAAKLRLPDATTKEIEERITDVLNMVDMGNHAEKPVRVLSGGQRKRVSIAVELLAEPDMLFLDEPTSGLDPGLEKKMMYDLNRLSDQGRTVVLITHATANIEQCHHVAFLVRGCLAYYGPPREAIKFFQAQDFADVYLKLSEEINPRAGKAPPPDLQSYYSTIKSQQGAMQRRSGSSSEAIPAGLLWAEHYRRSEQRQRYVKDRQSDISKKKGVQRPQVGNDGQPQSGHMRDSALRQLFLLTRRQFDLIRHDMRTLFVLLIMMPIIASLFMAVSHKDDLTGWQLPQDGIEARLTQDLEGKAVGENEKYIPVQNATQLITMLGLALTQAGTFSAAFEIVKEQSIFKREKAVNLRTTPYVLSKALVLGGFSVIQVASSLLILGMKVDLSFDPIFAFFPTGGWELFVTLLIAVFASIMLGLFISAVIPSADVLMYIILVQLFVQIILSGGLFPLDSPVSKLVISHWTMDAMGSTVDVPGLNEESMSCSVIEKPAEDGTGMEKDIDCGSAAVEELDLDYEHSEEHLLLTWGVLMGQAVVWCVLTIIVQTRKAAV
jgi:ABC-type multidrug transport system ATPase subunit